jgi:hypothetical protein
MSTKSPQCPNGLGITIKGFLFLLILTGLLLSTGTDLAVAEEKINWVAGIISQSSYKLASRDGREGICL